MKEKDLEELKADIAKVKALMESVEVSALSSKTILTMEEASRYTGFAVSYLYKLTSLREIPYYKPSGRRIIFNREELERWMQGNRITPNIELEMKAQAYCRKKGGLI